MDDRPLRSSLTDEQIMQSSNKMARVSIGFIGRECTFEMTPETLDVLRYDFLQGHMPSGTYTVQVASGESLVLVLVFQHVAYLLTE